MASISPVVTGIGCALPGGLDAAALLHPADGTRTPVDPAVRLGRRGLRYKDRATQLGLCAARDALRDADLWRDGALAVPADAVGVVTSSNLGNVDTVCRVVDEISQSAVAGTSPMDLPNASSNIIASTIAIRFGLRGVNLTLCNGATSGLDAVSWAAMLVASGRAATVLVVGAEPANPAVERLVGRARSEAGLLDGAVAVVVEAAAGAAARSAAVLAAVGAFARQGSLEDCLHAAGVGNGSAPGLWLGDGAAEPPLPLSDVPRADVTQAVGAASGALGVLQTAAAARWLAGGNGHRVLATAGGPGDDAVAALLLEQAGVA